LLTWLLNAPKYTSGMYYTINMISLHTSVYEHNTRIITKERSAVSIWSRPDRLIPLDKTFSLNV